MTKKKVRQFTERAEDRQFTGTSWTQAKVIQAMAGFDVSTEAGQLIFADWLEEHGETDWAFLCRVWTSSNQKVRAFLWPFPEWIQTENLFKPLNEVADDWRLHPDYTLSSAKR